MAEKQSYTYQNVSDFEQVVVGVGRVPAGESITVDEPFSNPNFKQVASKSEARRVAASKPATNSEDKE